ncbi:MAG: hypothetical protein M1814_001780 [Vezdaea aestivalis]|nr:MAG: hypothetical protein M1814_001780 [Vezdaea aestivalis]
MAKIDQQGAGLAKPVVVSLRDLEDDTVPFSALNDAFGPSSLGVLIVKDLPTNFVQLRTDLLSHASFLANLPESELQALESPESKYLTGWSLGKETLQSGRFDTLKGSYYVNGTFYSRPTPAELAETLKAYPTFPEYTAPNIWPATLPTFQPAFEQLCTLVIDTAISVAKACDRYGAGKVADYKVGTLEEVVRTSRTTKARLLHYFPRKYDEAQSEGEDDWCGTHVDHGCLTGLTSAMFVNEEQYKDEISAAVSGDAQRRSPPPNVLGELQASPDPEAGLYIHSRTGETVKVNIPKDCLAFQTGEALEVITKGRFKAVPHFVKGPKSAMGKVARNTLAVFTQPNLDYKIDESRTFAEFAREIVTRNTKVQKDNDGHY